MNRSLKDISHLFLSESQAGNFPASAPSREPTFDPERVFADDRFFPGRNEWEQILQWHRLCRALVAGSLVHLESISRESVLHQSRRQNVQSWLELLERIALGLDGTLEPVDLRGVVQGAAVCLQRRFVSRQTRYVETIPEHLPALPGIPGLLGDLLEHLLCNSLEAVAGVDREREVRVSLKSTPGDVFLTIGDNGEGATSEVLARMFFPFYSTRGRSGLGLFWVCQILELHRGRLKLWSQPAVGTEVYLHLPTGG